MKDTSTGANPAPWRYAIVPGKTQVDYGVDVCLLPASEIIE
ncbi:hypothetical protein [Thalassomonas actiniarum]|nr:hypothetical protein [Thalassomonas actiniarum]